MTLTEGGDRVPLQSTHLQPDACWLSDTGAPMGESGTTAWPGLWMAIPGICCHVEGMRICCVPAGQPCCGNARTCKGLKLRGRHSQTLRWNSLAGNKHREQSIKKQISTTDPLCGRCSHAHAHTRTEGQGQEMTEQFPELLGWRASLL